MTVLLEQIERNFIYLLRCHWQLKTSEVVKLTTLTASVYSQHSMPITTTVYSIVAYSLEYAASYEHPATT